MSPFFPFLIDRFRTVDTWIQMYVKNGFLTSSTKREGYLTQNM